MSTEFFDRAFDEATLTKLEIFRLYVSEWLPVFIFAQRVSRINIFDFFAGPGKDNAGNKGSPLLILHEFNRYPDHKLRPKSVSLYFNEYDDRLLKQLRANVEQANVRKFSVVFSKSDFRDAFESNLAVMQQPGTANLLLLDQFGVKHIDPDIFLKLVSLHKTDFIFFISSSTISRFKEHPAIIKYINIPADQIEKCGYYHIHRLVTKYYESLVPKDRQYGISQFSIKKNQNIYGVIFGSEHILGLEKFLKVCWKIDPIRGEANYDIDQEDIQTGELNLFSGQKRKARKVELFETELRDNILSGKLENNIQIYFFALNNGFLPKHVTPVLKNLYKEGKIGDWRLSVSLQSWKEKIVKNIRLK